MPATLLDKLLFPFIIPVVLGKTLLAAITGPFRGQEGAPAYGDHVFNTVTRTALGLLKAEQTQYNFLSQDTDRNSNLSQMAHTVYCGHLQRMVLKEWRHT